MKKLRVLALMHDYMVPPDDTSGHDLATAKWKTEFDVASTLEDIGHEVRTLGVKDDLGLIRQTVDDFKPDIAFNLMEAFHEIGVFDMNVVSYLELLRLPYTGCNPRGMLLSRDKALSKKLMAYHRIPVPEFSVFKRGLAIRRPRRLKFPVIVKSLTQEDGDSFFIGNSMPIRDVDKYTNSSDKRIDTYGNRGASGIDGIVSTALAISLSKPKKTKSLLLIGDISFYHDINGLLASKFDIDLTIVVINNSGGGIFSFLPIADIGIRKFDQFWTTDTGLNLVKVAELYNCGFYSAQNVVEIKNSIQRSLKKVMRLLNIHGKLQAKNVSRFLIKWNGKSRSKIQFRVKQFLQSYWGNQVVYEEFPVYGTRMHVDILNATKKIAVEVNGAQHSKFNKFFHAGSRLKYLESIKRDVAKAEWLERNGFTLVEIEEDEVDTLDKDFFKKNYNILL